MISIHVPSQKIGSSLFCCVPKCLGVWHFWSFGSDTTAGVVLAAFKVKSTLAKAAVAGGAAGIVAENAAVAMGEGEDNSAPPGSGTWGKKLQPTRPEDRKTGRLETLAEEVPWCLPPWVRQMGFRWLNFNRPGPGRKDMLDWDFEDNYTYNHFLGNAQCHMEIYRTRWFVTAYSSLRGPGERSTSGGAVVNDTQMFDHWYAMCISWPLGTYQQSLTDQSCNISSGSQALLPSALDAAPGAESFKKGLATGVSAASNIGRVVAASPGPISVTDFETQIEKPPAGDQWECRVLFHDGCFICFMSF